MFGTLLSYTVELTDVKAEVKTDVQGDGFHFEKFIIRGKWKSHVRKDNYAANALIDKIWGDNKNPYGDFELELKALDGVIVPEHTKYTITGVDDEPNTYARGKAEGLVKSKLAQISRPR